jgi:integrase
MGSDARQLTLPPSECPLVRNHSRGFVDAFERAKRRVLEPYTNKNTRRAYALAMDQWIAHCNVKHVPALPIEPSHLVTYLEARSAEALPDTGSKLAPNSVRLHLSALCALDQEARATPATPNPESVRDSFVVRRWLKSWSTQHPRAPRRKAPASRRDELERILVCAAEPAKHSSSHAHVARYARDRAILLFGFTGGFRADELARLELCDVTSQERGLWVVVRKSKTDQHGEGKAKVLQPQGQILRCPVDAWRAWLEIRGRWEGPAFVQIHRAGTLEQTPLAVDAIYRMVKSRAERAGLSFSSHTMRRTFATLARARGKSLEVIMRQVGWTEPKTAIGYLEQVDLFEDNPSAGLLDD